MNKYIVSHLKLAFVLFFLTHKTNLLGIWLWWLLKVNNWCLSRDHLIPWIPISTQDSFGWFFILGGARAEVVTLLKFLRWIIRLWTIPEVSDKRHHEIIQQVVTNILLLFTWGQTKQNSLSAVITLFKLILVWQTFISSVIKQRNFLSWNLFV